MRDTIKLNPIDGHIVLLCKHHYHTKDIVDALRRIWAVRCGYRYSHTDGSVYEVIANRLFEILVQCGESPQHINRMVHKSLSDIHTYGMRLYACEPTDNPLTAIILEYCSQISNLTVFENNHTLIELPKPKADVFKDILTKDELDLNYYDKISK